MDGIEVEYNMFREYHRDALLLPIASTGAATKIVYENLLPNEFKNERLVKDYGYMSLFQKLLMDKI
jgi:cytochrome c-type biogenesis protein CcmE